MNDGSRQYFPRVTGNSHRSCNVATQKLGKLHAQGELHSSTIIPKTRWRLLSKTTVGIRTIDVSSKFLGFALLSYPVFVTRMGFLALSLISVSQHKNGFLPVNLPWTPSQVKRQHQLKPALREGASASPKLRT